MGILKGCPHSNSGLPGSPAVPTAEAGKWGSPHAPISSGFQGRHLLHPSSSPSDPRAPSGAPTFAQLCLVFSCLPSWGEGVRRSEHCLHLGPRQRGARQAAPTPTHPPGRGGAERGGTRQGHAQAGRGPGNHILPHHSSRGSVLAAVPQDVDENPQHPHSARVRATPVQRARPRDTGYGEGATGLPKQPDCRTPKARSKRRVPHPHRHCWELHPPAGLDFGPSVLPH